MPVEIPVTFGFRVGVPSEGYAAPPAYALVYGWALSWVPPRSVVADLYLLRAASAVLGLLTLWVAWLAARESIGVTGGAIVALLLALHPHFAIVSTAASPDSVAHLFGACVWWQTAAAVNGRRIRRSLVAMWAAAIAAAAADRVGLPLLAVALLVSLVVMTVRAPRGRPQRTRMLAAAAVGGVIVLAATALALYTFGSTYGFDWVFGRGLMPVPGAITWDGFFRFTWLLHQGWWYSIGWGRYTPPDWWMALVTLLSVVAAAGLGRRFIRERTFDDRMRTILSVAVMAIAIQLIAVYGTYFRLGTGGQGRYLFPLLVPSMVLIWTGMEAWTPARHWGHAAAALILLFAILDAAAWILVAIPAYYASF